MIALLSDSECVTMSKNRLKKELANLGKEQLIEIILDLYSARKDAKNYFEFFLNPDSEKLKQRYQAIIAREFVRSERRMSRARISIIKKAIKEFESYSPDPDCITELYLYTIRQALLQEKHIEFPDPLINGISVLTTAFLDRCDRNLALDKALSKIDDIVNDEKAGSAGFRMFLKKNVEFFMSEKGL